jgi:electron transfer flavoprotein beta subunit
LRILTIVKQVPDSNVTVKVAADGTGIDMAGLKLVADPFDEFGIELAVQLREKGKKVDEIVALTVGGDKAAEALRVALAMGADRGIHVNDAAFESKNELFYAAVLAAAIQKEEQPFDLILCGKYNIDLDGAGPGPAVAEFLDLPHVGATTGFELADDGGFTARRRIEGAEEVLEGSLPLVLTIEKGMVEPRYPSLPNLMKAKKKKVAVLTAADLSVEDGLQAGVEFAELFPPPPRPPCKVIEGEPDEMAKELVRLLREEAKVI